MKSYIVASGNWEREVNAKNYMDAATLAVEEIFQLPEAATFGALISVWEKKHRDARKIEKQMFIYAPLVLANAGEYTLSEELKKGIDQMNFFN